MDTTPEDILTLALKLAPKERLQLIEQLAASVGRDMPIEQEAPANVTEHWGKTLVQLLNQLDPLELTHPEIDDPVEWVKQIRQDQDNQRQLNWGEDE